MASEAKGLMYIPVWVDDGVIKVLINDAGRMPVEEMSPVTSVDANIFFCEVTLPVSEQTPLTNIQARLYTHYGGTWTPVPVEADGSLHIHLNSQEADLGIAQATPALLQPGINSHIGGAWKKQPMIWGYSDRLYEDLSESAPDTGTWTKLSTVVPPGEIHKLEFMYVINDSRQGSSITFSAMSGGIVNYFVFETTVARYFPNVFVGSVTLAAGDYLRITMGGVNAGDTMKACIWGNKMDIDL